MNRQNGFGAGYHPTLVSRVPFNDAGIEGVNLLMYALHEEAENVARGRLLNFNADLHFMSMAMNDNSVIATHEYGHYLRGSSPYVRVAQEALLGYSLYRKPPAAEVLTNEASHFYTALGELQERLELVYLPTVLGRDAWTQAMNKFIAQNQALNSANPYAQLMASIFNGDPRVPTDKAYLPSFSFMNYKGTQYMVFDLKEQNIQAWRDKRKAQDAADIQSGRAPGLWDFEVVPSSTPAGLLQRNTRIQQAFQFFRENANPPAWRPDRYTSQERQYADQMERLGTNEALRAAGRNYDFSQGHFPFPYGELKPPGPVGTQEDNAAYATLSKMLFYNVYLSKEYIELKDNPNVVDRDKKLAALEDRQWDDYVEQLELDAEFRQLYTRVYGDEFFENILPGFLRGDANAYYGINE
ncbi:MAG: hypothetical protein KDD04_09215, partial [Sinomicrobium sp.]|nr:hypothetical protein [Sinomicrobium sp.]